MGRGRMFKRGVLRSMGQIATSVAATLIATQIYASLRHDAGAGTTRPVVPLTSGGKFGTRIAEAAPDPRPDATRPVLSLVDWAITPPHPVRLVRDIAWAPLDDDLSVAPSAAKPAPPQVRRAPAVPAAPPAVLPRLDLHPASATASADPGLWNTAAGAARSVLALVGSAVAGGGAALRRLIP